MKKRFKFRCWQCDKVYSLYREVNLKEKVLVACPFCGADAVVDFPPKEPTNVLRNMTVHEVKRETGVRLPDILPTKEIKD